MHKITATDPESHSADLLAANIAKLKELFPEVVAEGKVDFKALQEILGNEVESGDEFYRFTWAGKAQARREAHKPSTGTLRPCPAESVEWASTKNLYIEGDNLEVLKLLQKSYGSKVKMIYIDPPYNTGTDFVYKDNYHDNLRNYKVQTGQVDEEGNTLSTVSDAIGRYHSNWLNMIYPRLRLARNLLSEDGAIMIHIDEHEYSALEVVMKEVYGEENNLGTIVWDKRNPKGKVAGVAQQHELIIIFCKKREAFAKSEFFLRKKENAVSMIAKAASLVKAHEGVTDEVRRVYEQWIKERGHQLSGGEAAYDLIDDEGEVYQSVSMAAPDKPETRSHRPLIHPITKKPCPVPAKGWRFTDKTMDDLLERNRIVFGKDESVQPRQKYLLKENILESVASLLYYGGSDDALGVPFDNPKPVIVAQKLIDSICKPTEAVLDFFSGSGTTAHAVMQLNAEDGGQRQHIQVQLPAPTDAKSEAHKAGYSTIAEIGKERIRRAGKKIVGELEAAIKALEAKAMRTEEEEQDLKEKQERLAKLDIGFRVFKLDSSNIAAWDGDPERMQENLLSAAENIKPKRTEADVLYEVLLKYGLDLTLPIEERSIAKCTVYNVGMGALFLCLAERITNAVAEGIGQWKDELKPETCRVIFRDNGFTDVEKTNAMQTLKRYGVTEVRSV